MGIGGAVNSIVKNVVVGYKETTSDVRMSTGFTVCKCIYVHGNQIWHTSGNFSKDRRFFTPHGIDRVWRVTTIYFMDGVSSCVVCCDLNVDTIEFGKTPQMLPEELRKALHAERKELMDKAAFADTPEARQAALDSISFADYDIPGADILCSYAHDIINNMDLRFIQGVSRGKTLMLLIIGILLGMIMGGIGGSVLVLAFVLGGG